METTLAKFCIAEKAVTAGFDHLERYYGNVKMTELPVQDWMRTNVENYIQMNFDQVKQRTEAFHLNAESDTALFGTALSKDARKLSVMVVKRL